VCPRHARLLLATLICAGSTFAAPAASTAVEGSFEDVSTRIAVKLDDRLSSEDDKKGDVFRFELTGSVILDGIALGAGTRGHGVVTDVAPAAPPKQGLLTLEARSIDAAGQHFPVGLAPGSLDGRVVYEKGTAFFVISPPPQTPPPDPSESR
jgi:hypothetical protein